MLTGSFFMLQVYDRVLPGRSVPTLIALLALAIMLYVVSGRARSGPQPNQRSHRALSRRNARSSGSSMRSSVFRSRRAVTAMVCSRCAISIKSAAFLSSGGPTALFDLPWMPLYLGICFLFHFWIGMTALVGALCWSDSPLLTEIRTRGPTKASARFAMSRNALAVEGRRNAEVLQAMGMRHQAAAALAKRNQKYLAAHEAASDVASGLGGMSKVFRIILAIRAFSRSARIWSLIRNRRRASSLPARS